MTANEFLKDSNLKVVFNSGPPNLETIMIEFAKMHVKAALKAAAENVFTDCDEDNNIIADKGSILTAYPESNII